MGKSAGRHLMEEVFPNAFVKGNANRPTMEVVYEDSLQAIQTLGSGTLDPCNEKCTLGFGGQLFASAKRAAEFALRSTGSEFETHTYVMCYDKHEFVPIAKGSQQKTRDDNKAAKGSPVAKAKNPKGSPSDSPKVKRTNSRECKDVKEKPVINRTPPDGIPYKARRPYLVADQPVPRDIHDALTDRLDTRRDLIACMCYEWLDLDGPYKFDIPDGKRVIIDGHCLTLEHVKRLMFSDKLKVPLTQEFINTTPICLERIDTITWKLTWRTDLTNRIGEAEFSFFAIHKKLCEYEGRPMSAELISDDTDVMWLSLAYLYKLKPMDRPLVYMKYAPHISWVYRAYQPLMEYEQGVMTNQLFDDIEHARWMNPDDIAASKLITDDSSENVIMISDDLPLINKRTNTGAQKQATNKKTKSKKGQQEDSVPSNGRKNLPKKGSNSKEKEKEEDEDDGKGKSKKKGASNRKAKMSPWYDENENGHRFRQAFLQTEHKTINMIATMYMAGGDYNYGYYGITHESLFHAIRRYSDYIGSLVTIENSGSKGYNIILNGDAYARLIKSAYIVAKKLKKFDEDDDDGEKIVFCDPAMTDITEIEDMVKHMVPQNRFPVTHSMVKYAKQLSLYLKIVYQIGTPRLEEPLCIKYGHSKIDSTKPLCKENVTLDYVDPYTQYEKTVKKAKTK